jgi:hypothetical protein
MTPEKVSFADLKSKLDDTSYPELICKLNKEFKEFEDCKSGKVKIKKKKGNK